MSDRWYPLDDEYEVRRVCDAYEVRRIDKPDRVTTLPLEDFDRLRAGELTL
jgi:hypothetical protein